MKLLNDEQILGIKHGIEQGFSNQGYSLSIKENWIIDVTVKSIIEILEKMLSETL